METSLSIRNKLRGAALTPITKDCHLWAVMGSPLQKRWHFQADPPDNCQLNAKKLPKTWHFFKKLTKIVIFFNKIALGNFVEKMTIFVNFSEKMSSFWQFLDIIMAIFRRVTFWQSPSLLSSISQFINYIYFYL